MVKDGVCDKSNECSDENCRYCGQINSSEQCLVCKDGYVVLSENAGNKCIKEKKTTENCWMLTSSNIE